MKKIIFALLMIIIVPIESCKPRIKKSNYDVKIDFRFGDKYVSYKFNQEGQGYAVKGHCSNYTESFLAIDSINSIQFRFMSAKRFFLTFRKFQNMPVLQSPNVTDGMRTEMYYRGKKVYDSHFESKSFWDLFDPMMEEMPKGYSPFRPKDNVFN